MSEKTTNPYQNTATAKLIADRIRNLSHRKTQAEIASEAGFPNAKMMTFLKNGRNKVPRSRAVPRKITGGGSRLPDASRA